MMRITDVVKHLLVINVLVFFVTLLMWGDPPRDQQGYFIINEFTDWGRYLFALFFPASEYFRPFQIVTHMFMHGGISHLLFNMLGLFIFGVMLEQLWGPKRFLFYYLFCGFGSMLLYLGMKYLELNYWGGGALNAPMLGASGAIFGVMMGFVVNFPNHPLGIFLLPITIPAKYFVLIYLALSIFSGFGIFSVSRGVADFAHLGGAFFGYFLILYWEKYGTRL